MKTPKIFATIPLIKQNQKQFKLEQLSINMNEELLQRDLIKNPSFPAHILSKWDEGQSPSILNKL